MATSTEVRGRSSIAPAKRERIRSTIADVRNYRFCGPSDDPDEQTQVTLGYRYLLVQLQRLASPILPQAVAARLNALDIEVDNLYSVFAASAEIDALLPDIEGALDSLDTAERATPPTPAKPLPVPVCSVIGDVLGSFIYNHRALDALFYAAGGVGEVPEGNCVTKCQAWLKRMHIEVPEPAAVLGKVVEEFMEVNCPLRQEEQDTGRKRIHEVLARFGLAYRKSGLILGTATALPTESLNQILKNRDLAGVDLEFERALANVEKDPPSAITAACSILESLFKLYIEDNSVKMPADKSLRPLWKAAGKHLRLDPASVADDDIRKVLSGLNSVVDGIGSLRTHTGSAHGRGRRAYRLQARHARLAVHASHTLVAFFIETWDERKRRAIAERQRERLRDAR